MTTREPKIPGPDHPITIEATGVRVVARVGTHVVADTTRALTLREADYPPVQYIPLDAVYAGLVQPSLVVEGFVQSQPHLAGENRLQHRTRATPHDRQQSTVAPDIEHTCLPHPIASSGPAFDGTGFVSRPPTVRATA